MNNQEQKSVVLTCKQNGCNIQFVGTSSKLKHHQVLCKKHRNLGYKRTHMQKKKQLANQFMESKKVLSGTEALIGQPLSSFLDQVLFQKRLALMNSPDVLEHLKRKQKEVENKSKIVSNLSTEMTFTIKQTLANQSIPNQPRTKISPHDFHDAGDVMQNTLFVDSASEHLIENRNYVHQYERSQDKLAHKSLGIPLQDLENLEFLDTDLNFDISDFYTSCAPADIMNRFSQPAIVHS